MTRTSEVMWTNEYQSEKVQENVYSAVLRQMYKMFCLFHGTFNSILGASYDEENIQFLKDRLENFYNHVSHIFKFLEVFYFKTEVFCSI